MLKKYVFSLLTIFLYTITSYSLSIGTAPGVIDLGDVRRGETVPVTFYITSDTDTPLPITLSYIPVHTSILFQERSKKKGNYFDFIPKEASEEDISSWIKLPTKPYTLSPGNVKICNPPECDPPIKYNQKITFYLEIPKDAEPGYHAGSININPKLSKKGGGGASVSTIGVTRLVFVFRIPGNAKRDGRIIDFVAKRLSQNKVRIDVLFKNTGTDTISATLQNLKLYDEYGNIIYNLNNGGVKKVAPGRTAILMSYYTSPEEIPSGEYKSEATINYITGNAVKDTILKIPSEITLPEDLYEEEKSFPWWVLLVIILLIGLYVYWKM